MLSTDEVAELLHLNPKTVLVMVRDGRLPAHRLPGTRKFQFLTAEVMATLASGENGTTARTTTTRSVPLPEDVDPCDVWGTAPAPRAGGNWQADCLAHWIELACQAGLSTSDIERSSGARPDPDRRTIGCLWIDGLPYSVLVGPRRRVRLVDDEAETRWALIDAVWVEPLESIIR